MFSSFQDSKWRGDLPANLPDPARPFALDLRHMQVTDAGLKELAGLKSLQTLKLNYQTNVTDERLRELAEMKSLQSLQLVQTKVTNAGLRKLKESLTTCRILA